MCLDHPNAVNGFTSEEIIHGLQSADADIIFLSTLRYALYYSCNTLFLFLFILYLPMPYGSCIIRTLNVNALIQDLVS